jgi:putative serine rich protein
MNKFTVLLCSLAIVAAAGCTKSDDGGGKENPAGEEFTVKEVMKQHRSSKRAVSGTPQLPSFDIPALAPGVCWYYNWGHSVPSSALTSLLKANGMDFVPMIWNNNFAAATVENNIRTYANEVSMPPYLLAFNEPNLSDQADQTPAEAASRWAEVKGIASNLSIKLVSPALNYGTKAGYSDPTVWLDEFLQQDGVSADDMHAIALHSYMPNAAALKDFIHKFDKYGKPVLLTEFCRANGTITNNAVQQLDYMCEALTYLENDPMVEGYAWFQLRGTGAWAAISLMDSNAGDSKLTDLGKAYVYFSSFDESTYYGAHEAIPAEHYVATSNSVTAVSGAIRSGLSVCASGDADSMLDLTDFFTPDSWAEYQLELAESRSYDLAIRYLCDMLDGVYRFYIDGRSIGEVSFDVANGYHTKWVEGIDIAAGKHTLRVVCVSGRTDFNWFYLR